MMRCLRWLCLALLCGAGTAMAQGFSFVALGDLPYGPSGPYLKLIEAINRLGPDFSIHVGDIKSSATPCSDEELRRQRQHFDLYADPVVYTPGDNEWTDCHRPASGSYDPLERLAFLRQNFFTAGQSLGRRAMALQSQAALMPEHGKFVENARFLHRDLLFVTLHIVGSNNNFETRDPLAVAEFFERDRANVAWIQSAFALARERDLKALVFAYQAEVFEPRGAQDDFPAQSGFRNSIGQTLLPLAAQWGRPVLLIHGDGHEFKLDQPFKLNRRPLTQLTRLEVPGAGDVRAVRVTVDTSRPQPFAVELLPSP